MMQLIDVRRLKLCYKTPPCPVHTAGQSNQQRALTSRCAYKMQGCFRPAFLYKSRSLCIGKTAPFSRNVRGLNPAYNYCMEIDLRPFGRWVKEFFLRVWRADVVVTSRGEIYLKRNK